MSSIESLQWRYACKKFKYDKIIPEKKLTILKEAFNLTATSFGLQPIKMLILSDKELQQQLVNHCYGQEQVANASHILVICIDEDMTTDNINECFDREKSLRGTSEKIIAPFRKFLTESFAQKTIEEKQQSATYQAYIALGNLMTICAVERIDSCPMEGFIPEKIDKILELKKRKLKSVLLLPIGYRADDDLMSKLKKVRKPLEDIIINI